MIPNKCIILYILRLREKQEYRDTLANSICNFTSHCTVNGLLTLFFLSFSYYRDQNAMKPWPFSSIFFPKKTVIIILCGNGRYELCLLFLSSSTKFSASVSHWTPKPLLHVAHPTLSFSIRAFIDLINRLAASERQTKQQNHPASKWLAKRPANHNYQFLVPLFAF